MIRPYRRTKTYNTCSCGQVLYGDINKAAHLRSVRHLYGREIVVALEAGETLEAVGKKLHITRERVRQIGRILGVKPASQRKRERADQKALEDFFARLLHSRLGRFLEAAAKHGCSNQPVPLASGAHAGDYHRERALVNGKLVIVRASWERKEGYVSIKNPTFADVDYVAHELPDGRWLFLKPRDLGKHTMFAPYEVEYAGPGYSYTKRHDFREGIEAWHLFTNGQED